MNCTIMDRARSMKFHVGLSKIFWAACVDHAIYLVNRSPNMNLGLKCPEEVWLTREVDYSKFWMRDQRMTQRFTGVSFSVLDER